MQYLWQRTMWITLYIAYFRHSFLQKKHLNIVQLAYGYFGNGGSN
jgi:hypothetical protein